MKAYINLRDIKNIHNIKEIFEFLDKKLKPNIIIYNKELGLKKILDAKIEDYKEVSGKYIEGRRNRKGREYIIKTNALIFEGEYLMEKEWKRKRISWWFEIRRRIFKWKRKRILW